LGTGNEEERDVGTGSLGREERDVGTCVGDEGKLGQFGNDRKIRNEEIIK
jgi:hypothetical protein